MATGGIAVIGGGSAGCAAAYHLARARRDVVLLERAAEVGGRTVSWRREDGAVVDSGAGFFTNFYPELEGLLDPLGLRGDIVPMSRSNVLVRDGREAELTLGSTRSFLAFPLASRGAKLRMAAATAAAALRHRGLDLTDPAALAALDDRSVRDEALRSVGEEAYEVLVRPGIEPFWYFSCAEVSRALFLALQARAPTATFSTLRDGMGSIARELAARAGEVRTGVEVARVEPGPGGEGVLVDGEPFAGAVVATTATVARAIVDPALLPAPVGRHVATRRYVPNVHAVFDVPREVGPPGSTAFPAGPGVHRVAAVARNSVKHQGTLAPGRELVSVFLGAQASAELLGRPDDEVAGRAWELGRSMCPRLVERAEHVWVAAREEAIPVHEVGGYRSAAAAQAAQRPPVVLAGDHLATATVDGALRTGRLAAERLAA